MGGKKMDCKRKPKSEKMNKSFHSPKMVVTKPWFEVDSKFSNILFRLNLLYIFFHNQPNHHPTGLNTEKKN